MARSTFRSQMLKNTRGSDHFWTFRCRFAWQAQGIVHFVKSEQNMRVLWHFQKRWQAWNIWRGSAKMNFPWQAQYKRHVHQSPGADFVRRVAFWSIKSSGLLRWFCVTGAALRILAEFRIVSFLMLSTSKNEEVSQNCFVIDVVKCKNWGSLAELLRFWCCQVQKLRKSRRTASFSNLQIDRQTDR